MKTTGIKDSSSTSTEATTPEEHRDRGRGHTLRIGVADVAGVALLLAVAANNAPPALPQRVGAPAVQAPWRQPRMDVGVGGSHDI